MSVSEQVNAQYLFERRAAKALLACPLQERPKLYRETYHLLQEYIGDQPHDTTRETELKLLLLSRFLGPEVRLAEFGAGDATLSRAVAEEVKKIYAIDIVAPELGQAPPNLEFLCRDCLSVPEMELDVVFSCHFIEHLHPEDARRHISQALDVLSPGGCYICVTPNRLLGPHDISKFFDEKASGLHLREYSYRDLCHLFLSCGFSSVKILRGVGRTPSLHSPSIYLMAEKLVELLPRRLRKKLAGWVRKEPFRPLEQVRIAAFK